MSLLIKEKHLCQIFGHYLFSIDVEKLDFYLGFIFLYFIPLLLFLLFLFLTFYFSSLPAMFCLSWTFLFTHLYLLLPSFYLSPSHFSSLLVFLPFFFSLHYFSLPSFHFLCCSCYSLFFLIAPS